MPDNITLDPGTGGATLAADDIGGVVHQRVKMQFGADGSATDVSTASPLPIVLALDSPQTAHATTVALAAGASTDLDSAQIASGKTGELVAIVMAASVALKGQLFTVLNGAPSTIKATLFSLPSTSEPWTVPSKKFFTQAQDAGAGFDGFRLTVTNEDTTQPADVYVTFLYDETG